MSMYATYKTDDGLERTGIYLDQGDFRVKIARAGGGNRKFSKMLEAKTRPYRRQMQLGLMDEAVSLAIMHEVYAQTIVLGWEVWDGTYGDDGLRNWKSGIEMPDGSTGPASPKNYIEAFKNLPDLFQTIMEQSAKASLFRAHALEEEAGN